jgi:hypothetical protein
MDIDKVIKGLECHGKGGSRGCLGCPYELTHGCQLILCHDALVMIKEQDETIKQQQAEIGKWIEAYEQY